MDGIALPVVVVWMWERRTRDQKEKLVKGIAKAFEDIGTKAEHLDVIINDVSKTDSGKSGQLVSNLE
jgi:phenylpyruvate tautomerase PptA (4-oxalocrotonate tautomerase family)